MLRRLSKKGAYSCLKIIRTLLLFCRMTFVTLSFATKSASLREIGTKKMLVLLEKLRD